MKKRSGKVVPNTGVGGRFLRYLGGLGGRPLASLCALVSRSGAETASPMQTAMIHKSEHLRVIILQKWARNRQEGILFRPKHSFI